MPDLLIFLSIKFLVNCNPCRMMSYHSANPIILTMETRVIYRTKESLTNPKLSIIQFLIKKGVFVDSIQVTPQELAFKAESKSDNPDEHWCIELNEYFKGKIDFMAKRPSKFS
jgi:hypothetical protein